MKCFCLLFSLLISWRAFASSWEKIPVPAGPEDIHLDLDHEYPRLIVSSGYRSKGKKHDGVLSIINLDTHEVKELRIVGDVPRPFNPHGIFYLSSKKLLYVISHRGKVNGKRVHDVLLFRLTENSLIYKKNLAGKHSKFLISPNDIHVLSNGEVFVTNLGFMNNSVVHYHPKTGKWRKIIGGLFFANGIFFKSNRLYVTTSLSGNLREYIYKGKAGLVEKNRRVAKNLKVADNISFTGDQHLLIASHDNLISLLRYSRCQRMKCRAKGNIYRIEPQSKNVYMATNPSIRDIVNAPSTAVLYKNRLYIAQVFDSFIFVEHDPRWRQVNN